VLVAVAALRQENTGQSLLGGRQDSMVMIISNRCASTPPADATPQPGDNAASMSLGWTNHSKSFFNGAFTSVTGTNE
jgi:hypothetical protein